MTDGPTPRGYVHGEYQPTRAERALDRLTDWRTYIVLAIIGALIANELGWITLPEITDLHKLILLGLIGGYLVVGKLGVWPRIEGRVESRTVRLYLTGLEGKKILDYADIPEDDWWRLDTINGLKERYTLGGRVQFVARAVDLSRSLVVSAGDRPNDDSVPDDIELLGSGADELYHKLRGIILDEFRAGTARARDRQIMVEEANRRTSNQYDEDFEEIRNGSGLMEEREMRAQERTSTESLLRERAVENSDSEGESDE